MPIRSPGPAKYACGFRCAACAVPTCISRKATCRRGSARRSRVTRSSARLTGSGRAATRFGEGERVGIAWLRHTCGVCTFCRRGDENLCIAPRFTGWDADGGYAEYAVVDEAFAYRIPEGFPDEQAAPLLCSGIIGYRALRRTGLRPGGRLGIYGFGASAHLAAQIALHENATVHVMTRSTDAQRLALELGCASAGDATAPPPEPLDAAVLFAPVGDIVPPAMRALDRGGVLSVAGIYLSDIPRLVYADELFEEKVLTSTTANTCRDGEALLALATRGAAARHDDGVRVRARRRCFARPRARPGERRGGVARARLNDVIELRVHGRAAVRPRARLLELPGEARGSRPRGRSRRRTARRSGVPAGSSAAGARRRAGR